MARHRERGASDRRPSALRHLLDPPSGMARGLLSFIIPPNQGVCQPASKKGLARSALSDSPNADEQRFKQIDYRATEDLSLNELRAGDLPLGLAINLGSVAAN